MQAERSPVLQVYTAAGGQAQARAPGVWRLEIPAGAAGVYRLAQLDDYRALSRRKLPWQPPLTFQVRARSSAQELPGTWGFGLWNDPFSFSLGLGGGGRRLPALPNTAWFFFASPPNHLSLRDDQPGCGALAQVFRSPRLPGLLLGLGLPALPFLLLPPAARILRHLARCLIRQDGASLTLDPTYWHTYTLAWQAEGVSFSIDSSPVFATVLAPRGPLGLVLWVDNQYAAFTPQGRLGYGFLANPQPAWVELAEVSVRQGD
jgi:hypothetical protein